MQANLGNDRLSLRGVVRRQMIDRGLLTFCEDDAQEDQEARASFRAIQERWFARLARQQSEKCPRSLLKRGIAASTTDHHLQGIGSTLIPNQAEFWSSTGSGPEANECLLYTMASSMCCVRYVQIAFYRATYQHGDPVYPSFGVSFYVGHSPTQMYLASPVYPVEASDRVQVFALSASAPAGSHFAVRFHGKRQQQWEDSLYYIAVRHVSAHGTALPLHSTPSIQHATRNGMLEWGKTAAAHTPTSSQNQPPAEPHDDSDNNISSSSSSDSSSSDSSSNSSMSSAEIGGAASHACPSFDPEASAAAAGLQGEWAHLTALFRSTAHLSTAAITRATACAAQTGQSLSVSALERCLQSPPTFMHGVLPVLFSSSSHTSSKGRSNLPDASRGGSSNQRMGSNQEEAQLQVRADLLGGLLGESGAIAQGEGGTATAEKSDSDEGPSVSGTAAQGGLRGWLSGWGRSSVTHTAGTSSADVQGSSGSPPGEQAARQTTPPQPPAQASILVVNLIHWLLRRIQGAAGEAQQTQEQQEEQDAYLQGLTRLLGEDGGVLAGPSLVQQLLHLQSELLTEEEEEQQQQQQQQEAATESLDSPMEGMNDDGRAEQEREDEVRAGRGREDEALTRRGRDDQEGLGEDEGGGRCEGGVQGGGNSRAADMEVTEASDGAEERGNVQSPMDTDDAEEQQQQGACGWPVMTEALMRGSRHTRPNATSNKSHKKRSAWAMDVLFCGSSAGVGGGWPVSDYDVEFLAV